MKKALAKWFLLCVVVSFAGVAAFAADLNVDGKIVVDNTVQNAPRLLLTGQEVYLPGYTDTSGVALLLGVNRPNNRQLWIADWTANAQENGISSSALLRIMMTANYVDLGSLTPAGTAPRTLTLNVSGGNVGIGTHEPAVKLHLLDAEGSMRVQSSVGTNAAYHSFVNSGGTYYVGAENSAGTGLGGTAYALVMSSPASRNVQLSPGGAAALTASPGGNVHVTGNLTAGGTIFAKFQDVAEFVPTVEALEPGMVVVVAPQNHVAASTEAYDTRVAGVISPRPGLALGEPGESKVLVATTGRVKVRVDASSGPVHAGDILVSSPIRGMAMKSEPLVLNGRKFHQPGTVIGKALESIEKGTGEILVLLSLQ